MDEARSNGSRERKHRAEPRRERSRGAGVAQGGHGRERRRRLGLVALAAAAVVAGGSAAIVGGAAATGAATGSATGTTGSGLYGSGTAVPSQPGADGSALARLRARMAELRALEAAAVRRHDVAEVQGLEVELNELQRRLEVVTRHASPAAVRPALSASTTPPVSGAGVFSDSRDTAFESAMEAADGRS